MQNGEVLHVWKKNWKTTVPNIVKVFMWRFCKNGLPTQANLIKRKVVDDPLCPICGVVVETTGHILWSCP